MYQMKRFFFESVLCLVFENIRHCLTHIKKLVKCTTRSYDQSYIVSSPPKNWWYWKQSVVTLYTATWISGN